jgi:hypothetical protein
MQEKKEEAEVMHWLRGKQIRSSRTFELNSRLCLQRTISYNYFFIFSEVYKIKRLSEQEKHHMSIIV